MIHHEFRSRPMTAVFALQGDTPIGDRLHDWIGSEALATWNRDRGPGGEWDSLRAVPYRRRAALTSAGFLSKQGMMPDDFADLLVREGGAAVGGDPIAWYVREASAALRERRLARRAARERALAHAGGHSSLFEHRDALARAAGHRSYFYFRKAQGWT